MPRSVLPAILLWAGLAASAAQAQVDDFVPVTDAMLEQPAPGDWLMWRRTQNGWAYSPLDADQQAQRRDAQAGLDARAGRRARRKQRRSSTAA